jgi:hypothetical protein
VKNAGLIQNQFVSLSTRTRNTLPAVALLLALVGCDQRSFDEAHQKGFEKGRIEAHREAFAPAEDKAYNDRRFELMTSLAFVFSMPVLLSVVLSCLIAGVAIRLGVHFAIDKGWLKAATGRQP